MKRVLVLFLGALMLVSLSLVVSCQKKEETGVTEEKAAGYGEQAVKEAAEKAGGSGH